MQEISIVNIGFLDGVFKGNESLAYKKKQRDKRRKEKIEMAKTSKNDMMLDLDTNKEHDDKNSYKTVSDCDVISPKLEEDFNEDQEESFLQYFEEKRNEGSFFVQKT